MLETITATHAQSHFFELVENAVKEHRQYRIAHEAQSVVLLSEEEYESLLETLYLLSIPNFMERK